MSILLSPIFFIISYFFPKNINLWCFGAWFGERYADNSRYLYEYASMHKPNENFQAVWITNDKNIVAELSKKGLKAYYKFSFKGLFCQLRAKVFICSVNSKDFYFAALSPRNFIVQLWHGSPMKKIGFDTIKKRTLKYLTATLRANTIDKYSILISPAPVFDNLYASAFKLKPGKILRSGYPRCDGLFLGIKEVIAIRSKFCKHGQRLILYLPTHRGEGNESSVIKQVITEFHAIDSELEKLGLVILIKPHFYDVNNLSGMLDTGNIKIVKDFDELELYQVLGASDGLITDYSSVFLDYDILKKPIYFLAPDLDWYLSKEREMYFEYTKLALPFHKNVLELLPSLTYENSGMNSHIEVNVDKNGQYSKKLFEALQSIIYSNEVR